MAEKEFKHMVRVANTDLPGKMKIVAALRKIRGVSFAFASAACSVANIDKTKVTGELADNEIKKLNEVVADSEKHLPAWMLNRRKDYESGADKHLLTGELEFARQEDVRRMQRTKSYKGLRHAVGLPVRGQRTRSNFRKNKGRVMGVIKKKFAAQQKGKQKGKSDKKGKK